MIEISTKIHDRYSIEFKVGFVADGKSQDEFLVGMWIFVPGSLDITPTTFTKAEFYRSVKSNIRLITPHFPLAAIAGGDAVPLRNVQTASSEEREYQMKLFCAITRSALRDGRNAIRSADGPEAERLSREYVAAAREILNGFFNLPACEGSDYCGEFLCNVITQYAFGALPASGAASPEMKALLHEVEAIRAGHSYAGVSLTDAECNRDFVHRHSILKKYVESQLYLRVPRKRDGVLAEQAYFSLAAGMAMIFATVVAWAFQRTFGNLTWPLFIALIISYMMKDRIKELMRFWFAHRVSDRYFDRKAKMSSHGIEIGQLKEAMDFIPLDKVPEDIDAWRNRIHLFSAEDRFRDENVILYRKKVQLDRKKLEQTSTYAYDGVNDIIRIQVRPFLRKMDNPQSCIYALDESGEPVSIPCDRDYFINIILQYRYAETVEYKRFRIALNRDGIKSIDEIK